MVCHLLCSPDDPVLGDVISMKFFSNLSPLQHFAKVCGMEWYRSTALAEVLMLKRSVGAAFL
jgi:hypothetical protein